MKKVRYFGAVKFTCVFDGRFTKSYYTPSTDGARMTLTYTKADEFLGNEAYWSARAEGPHVFGFISHATHAQLVDWILSVRAKHRDLARKSERIARRAERRERRIERRRTRGGLALVGAYLFGAVVGVLSAAKPDTATA